jgi:hypothetical protein
MADLPRPDDLTRVEDLLGRRPQGRFEVVVRTQTGDPVVIANAPLLDDHTPMPTRYWLVGPAEIRAVSRLEASGGVNRAEEEIDPDAIADAHRRYAVERDALIANDHDGPRPFGGVGGTRQGVKCLHAHYAWFLAGGDDPVGAWVAERLADDPAVAVPGVSHHDPLHEPATGPIVLELDRRRAAIIVDDRLVDHLPVDGLIALGLLDGDPPAAADLSNALGLLDDTLSQILGQHPALREMSDLVLVGPLAEVLARVERGVDQLEGDTPIDREAFEEVFRTLLTESHHDRAANPGLPAAHVDDIVITLCSVAALMRRFHLGLVTVRPGHESLLR